MIPQFTLANADCLEWLRAMPTDSADLVVCSPPYEAARTYGIDFKLRGQAWVDWALERYLECVRVSRGAVVWVVEGQTRRFCWSASPVLLMADLHRRGVQLRKPPIYQRVGIPGGGGPDWFRNDYEFCIASTKGKLPWSDNTAMGHTPKWAPGGDPSHRLANGRRVAKVHTKRGQDEMQTQGYNPPAKANPGNVIACKVGGGRMGSELAHENEAPYPERVPEWFIRACCPPGGLVLDPFLGSGTTLAVAKKWGRCGAGCDVRASQIELARRRLDSVEWCESIERHTAEPVPADD